MRYLMRIRKRLRNRGIEKGQSFVELAFLLPVILVCVLLFLQVSVVLIHRIELSHAVREAARIASVDSSSEKAIEVGKKATGLRPSRLHLQVGERPPPGGFVTVTGSYEDPILVPLTKSALFTAKMDALATMMVER